MSLQGCYYLQAVRGHMDLMGRTRPIAELVDDPQLSADTRNKLELVREARRFSVDRLLLADNNSYQNYADLERDYVVWNVFAAKEFALVARQWCFPVAGCVGYRGYFHEQDAVQQARRLRKSGYDVAVGGVTAYSTLGRFADPVLNTMLAGARDEIVSTLFHELAHQRIYVKGDTGFNESFASAVEEAGVIAWFEAQGDTEGICRYQQRQAQRDQLQNLVADYRKRLAELYEQSIPVDKKREAKAAIFAELGAAIKTMYAGNAVPGWFRDPINNATLIPLALYRDNLPAFREILGQCQYDFACFYGRVEDLAELSSLQRQVSLIRLVELSAQRVFVEYCSVRSDLDP